MVVKKNDIVKTNRLTLKSFSECDFEKLISIMQNEEVGKTYMVPTLDTFEKKRNMFNRFKALSESTEHFIYGVYYNDILVGFINDVEIVDKEIELGFVIEPNYKNNGFATETLIKAIDELFKAGFEVVKTGVFIENKASARVMIKSGMKKVDKEEVIEYRGENKRCYCFEIYNK